jgi:hypothetical protein
MKRTTRREAAVVGVEAVVAVEAVGVGWQWLSMIMALGRTLTSLIDSELDDVGLGRTMVVMVTLMTMMMAV